MPRDLYNVAKARGEDFTFYCPNGHPRAFIKGPTKEQRLQEELSQARQRLAMWMDEAKAERERANREAASKAAYKGVATRTRNRIKNGVCPCCNRTFSNLAAHMANLHPKFGSGNDVEQVCNPS